MAAHCIRCLPLGKVPRLALARDREGPLPRTCRPDPDRALPPGDSAPPAELGVRAILPVRHRQQWSPCLLGTAVPETAINAGVGGSWQTAYL